MPTGRRTRDADGHARTSEAPERPEPPARRGPDPDARPTGRDPPRSGRAADTRPPAGGAQRTHARTVVHGRAGVSGRDAHAIDRVGVGFLEGRGLLPFYTSLISLRYVPMQSPGLGDRIVLGLYFRFFRPKSVRLYTVRGVG